MAAAEEIGPHSGRHPGNFRQAFSHLALINAVMHLIQADERLSAGATISSGLDPTAGPAPAGPRRAFPAPAMTPLDADGWIDVSVTVTHGMAHWPDNPPVVFR